MSTLEALNAISEAIEAHKILPDIQRQLKEAREAHDYALLELDDARVEIERLKDALFNMQAEKNFSEGLVKTHVETITELRDRNHALDKSLAESITTMHNQEVTIAERNLQIESLILDKKSLESRLADAKSYGERLTETLRSIGSKIVAAVEVPEVTSSKPFPVADTVGLSPSPSDQNNDQSISQPARLLAEPTDADLVGVAEDNSSSSELAAGCSVYKYW